MIEVESFKTPMEHLDRVRCNCQDQREARQADVARAMVSPGEFDLYLWGLFSGAHGPEVTEAAHLIAEQSPINFSWLLQLAGACYLDAEPLLTRRAFEALTDAQREELTEDLRMTCKHWSKIGHVRMVQSDQAPATSYGGSLLHNYKAGLIQVECLYPDGLERVEDYVFYGGRWHNCHLLDNTRAGVRWSEPKGFSPQAYAIECKQKNGVAND